jgi:subtilisin family serine protease
MGAPINDWGMVGFWPAVRIVSVRAAAGSEVIPSDSYQNGVERCRELRMSTGVRVISLALAGAAPTEAQQANLREVMADARRRDLSVVVAAGNNGGAPSPPSTTEPSLAVGAVDPAGQLCDFSARGAGVDIFAPGCGMDTADPATGSPLTGAGGTSQAASEVAALIASLRTARPELSADNAEQLVLRSARSSPVGPVLDARSAFELAGRSDLYDDTAAARLGTKLEVAQARGASDHHRGLRITSVRRARHGLTVRIVGRPSRQTMSLIAYRRGRVVMRRRMRTSTAIIPSSSTRVCIRTRVGLARPPIRACRKIRS